MNEQKRRSDYFFSSDEEFINFILQNEEHVIIKKASDIAQYSLRTKLEPFLWIQKSQEELDAYKKLTTIFHNHLDKLVKQENLSIVEEEEIDHISQLFTQLRYTNSNDLIFEIISKTQMKIYR